jgi:methyl-accepting chemotaxis protein
MPSYSKLTTPHKEVHENIKKAIDCVVNGTCEEQSTNVITYFKDAEKASKSVTEVLNAILKEEKIGRFEAK